MAKRRAIIHVEDNKYFKTMSAAEKEYSIPAGMLSEAMKLGKPCKGHVFKFADDEGDNSESKNFTSTSSSKTNVVKNLQPTTKSIVKVDGDDVRRASYDEAVVCLTSIGYECEDIGGMVMIFNLKGATSETYDSIQSNLDEIGYRNSWGCTGFDRDTYLKSINSLSRKSANNL